MVRSRTIVIATVLLHWTCSQLVRYLIFSQVGTHTPNSNWRCEHRSRYSVSRRPTFISWVLKNYCSLEIYRSFAAQCYRALSVASNNKWTQQFGLVLGCSNIQVTTVSIELFRLSLSLLAQFSLLVDDASVSTCWFLLSHYSKYSSHYSKYWILLATTNLLGKWFSFWDFPKIWCGHIRRPTIMSGCWVPGGVVVDHRSQLAGI